MNDSPAGAHDPHRRDKLGLALAGGGFRASLFHLGVLRRMAELDLLRSVEVLSTVSGGSIIGALYVLVLKKYLDQSETLSNEQYRKIIDELERILIPGIKKNLRTRLFMNPFGLLRVLVTSDTLGRRMSRLYERYVYRDIVEQLQPDPPSWWKRLWLPGRIPLKNVFIRPGGTAITNGIERYNRSAVERKGSVITSLILNATSLNSGAPFRFSSVEIGDARLGFFRNDEIAALLKRRRLLFEQKTRTLDARLAAPGEGRIVIGKDEYERRTVSLAAWWRRRREQSGNAASPAGWKALFDADGFPGRLVDVEFGLLRQIKLPAWYLGTGMNMTPEVDGGLTKEEHERHFWKHFSRVDETLSAALQTAASKNENAKNLLVDFVVEIYYLRSAEVMSGDIADHWNALRLGEAVGASACFPPVFPPFIMHEFYDDSHVTRLGLTDGGVYDNLGTTALCDEDCNHIIASDTGGLFTVTQQSSTGRIGMSGRIVSILMDAVAQSQGSLLREQVDASAEMNALAAKKSAPEPIRSNDDLQSLAYFHIVSPAAGNTGLKLDLDPVQLASLRTDLDGFGDVEIAALVDHGYDTADRYLRRGLAGSPYANAEFWKPADREPMPILRDSGYVKKILHAGKSRFFRALMLQAPCSILFSLAVILAVVLITWKTRLSLQDVVAWLTKLTLGWIDSIVSFLGAGWTRHHVSVGVFIAAAVLAAIVIVTVKVRLTSWLNSFKKRYLQWFSTLSTVYKWARSLSQNVVWVSGLVPLAVAFGGAALAWISHLFYYLPFERMTRNAGPAAPRQRSAPREETKKAVV